MRNRLYPTFTEYLKTVQKNSKQEVKIVQGDDIPYGVQEARNEQGNFSDFQAHEKLTIYANDNELKDRKAKAEEDSYGDDYLDNA